MIEDFYENNEPTFYEGWHQQCRGVSYPPIQIEQSPYEDSLFSRREMYVLSCTPSGKLISSMLMSTSARAKAEYNNLHLIKGMHLTQRYGFPILSQCKECPVLDCVPYSSRNERGKREYGVHFFEHDHKFKDPLWDRLDQTTFRLRDKPFLFTPDYSLYVGPMSAINITAIYRSRFAGAFWALCGYTVIPTASWGDADSYSYCFDGLPLYSVIGVCGIGICSHPGALELWHTGLSELESRLHPIKIIIYGKEREIPGINTPVEFILPYSKEKFQNRIIA